MPFVYRPLFIVFGLALGLLLWSQSRREQEFRRLSQIYERFHREVADPAFLIHQNARNCSGWMTPSFLAKPGIHALRLRQS